jgi:hypothetical protein
MFLNRPGGGRGFHAINTKVYKFGRHFFMKIGVFKPSVQPLLEVRSGKIQITITPYLLN